MRFRLTLFGILSACLCQCLFAADGPLQVPPLPTGWELSHTSTNSLDLYVFTIAPAAPKQDSALLIVSTSLMQSKVEEIPAQVRTLADLWVKRAKQSPSFSLVSEKYAIEQFAGKHCKGSYVVFEIKQERERFVQAMYRINVDGKSWDGQFIGSSGSWKDALKILRALEKHP